MKDRKMLSPDPSANKDDEMLQAAKALLLLALNSQGIVIGKFARS